MLPLESMSFRFWFEVMTPRLNSSNLSCQELSPFPAEVRVGGSRSPSIQSRSLSLRFRHFWFPKKGSEGQTIHLERRRQTIRAKMVHNAAPGILRDSHSPHCVAVGQVFEQPESILLTYRYWFLFLGLRLFCFLMPLILQIRRELFKY